MFIYFTAWLESICLIHLYLSKVWYQAYISFTSIWDTDTVSCYWFDCRLPGIASYHLVASLASDFGPICQIGFRRLVQSLVTINTYCECVVPWYDVLSLLWKAPGGFWSIPRRIQRIEKIYARPYRTTRTNAVITDEHRDFLTLIRRTHLLSYSETCHKEIARIYPYGTLEGSFPEP